MRETDYKDGSIQVHRYEFSDWSDLLGFAADKTRVKVADEYCRYSESTDVDFTSIEDMRDSYTHNLAEAIELASKGWHGGAKRIQQGQLRHFEALSNRIVRDDPINDMEGVGFDVALVLANEPEAWLRYEASESEITGAQGNIIRIVLNASVSAAIDTSVIFRRGEAIAAVCELLEHAGHRAEVVVMPVCATDSYRRNMTKRVEAAVLVKAAHQPMDFARLAFALCHPSMLRRLGFKCLEEAGKDYEAVVRASYGFPATPSQNDRDAQVYVKEAGADDPDFYSEDSARAWVVRMLEAQGVELRVS